LPRSPRRVIYFVAVSLDGFIADPTGDWSRFPTEGDHIEMLARDWPDTLPAPALAALGVRATNERFDTVLMGWNTYAPALEQGVSEPYPHLRQYVFSRRTPDARTSGLPSLSVVDEDPRQLARRLKAEPTGSDIWCCGGGTLAAALWPEIDALVLKVNPIVLGTGIPLVAGPVGDDPFTLVSSTPYRSGVVVNEYVRTTAEPVE
jgi:dihydrofolate reductase